VSFFSNRRPAVAIAAVGFLLLNLTLASLMFVAVYQFDPGMFANHGALFERGPASVGALRLGSIVDMAGYLALTPVVLHLRGRLHPLATCCGLGFVMFGALGAILMASAGPWLLGQSGSGSAEQAAAQVQFGALESIVFVGLWGALGLALLSGWILAICRAARDEGRAFSWLGAIAALGALGYSLRSGLTGDTPFALTSALDPVILGAVAFVWPWTAWLAARLWRGGS
jgi:hypothetical protein